MEGEQDRRASNRGRMLKGAKIILGKASVPCTVRNLSTGGACLQVQTTAGIPSIFHVAMADGTTRPCKVTWLDETRLGVQFQ